MISFPEALERASAALGGDATLAAVLYTDESEIARWRCGLARPPRPLALALAELLQFAGSPPS